MIVLAAVAHPDDIEFMMAGTLLRLKDAGCEIHLWTLADGSCGSNTLSREETAALRWKEAQASARLAGGQAHPPLFPDLEVFYNAASLAKVASVVRRIRPDIVLTHPFQDYMEDHQNVARLIVTATFMRGMKNGRVDPVVKPYEKPVALYHALPHGLQDGLRQKVVPDLYVDISDVLFRKRSMLSCHVSQKQWLDQTQGMDAYLDELEKFSAEVGKKSGQYPYAEGWLRHSHLGMGPENLNPLKELLRLV